jgi:signal peptidase I
VVVVRLPARGIEAVKRVVGLPGERIRVMDGRAEIDGRQLAEPYAHGMGVSGEWSLGHAEYLVLGDDRSESTDGRTFGPVPREAIAGVVRFRYWPKAGRVR